jgi:hypothetical protein
MESLREAVRGSKKWIQRAVSTQNQDLERKLASSVGRPGDEVTWKAPLGPKFSEPRDRQVLNLLKIETPHRDLAEFWPRGGAVWDALAVIKDQYVLLEAKAHIPEMISGPSKAGSLSLPLIEASLKRTRRSLAPRSKSNWAASPFFQYANRLAFLEYLREDNRIDAHLAFVYFTNDKDMDGPESEAEWKGAIRLMEASLGFNSHRLSPFVHKLFIDCRPLMSPNTRGS